jgi:peptide/nickel transport system substrate-binding protein
MKEEPMFKSKTHISRRAFITGLGAALGGTALAACTPAATPTAAPVATKPAATQAPAATKPPEPTKAPAAAATAVPASKYKEAPMMADLVKAGKLPPVDKRLPDNPMVYKGPDGDGVYGGQLKYADLAGTGSTQFDCFMGYEPLVRYNAKWDIEPNIAESWKINEKMTEITFLIRKGIKWSDGAPFTTKDIMFWWNDVLMNKDVTPTPAPPAKIKEVVAIDDLNIKFNLGQTNVMFMDNMAHPGNLGIVAYPSEFCKKFHAKYNTDAQAQAKAAGFERWQDWLNTYGSVFGLGYNRMQPGTPSMSSWIGSGTERFTAKATQFELARNPYYWKVDGTGQQYPYTDKVVVKFVSNSQGVLLEGAAGNITYQRFNVNGLANRAFHVENGKKGNYRMRDFWDSWGNSINIQVNLTHANPDHTKVNRDKNFRIGLSHAINRKEMIDTLFLGTTKPHQVAPLLDSPYYNKQLATQYLEYDVKKANEYLDKVLPKKDAEGFRLGPDGKQYMFIFTVVDRENYKDISELLARYWKAVGVRTEVRLSDRSTHDKVIEKAEHDCSLWSALAGMDVRFSPQEYTPVSGWNDGKYAPKWARWYTTKGKDPAGEEPPDQIKKQFELFDKTLEETDPKKNLALFAEILQICADEFLNMGVSTPAKDYAIVNNDLKNVPDTYFDWAHGLDGPTNPWAFYFKKA